MSGRKRCAIVTPYFKEERQIIERCIRSVQAQRLPAEHILVADGRPQDWIDGAPVRHVKLDRNHADFGNTPRGIGAMLAIVEGYEGVGLLDADNWLEENHTARCMEAARQNENCDYVIARRNMCRTDGSVIDVEDEPVSVHVDTNCFFLLPGSYHVMPYFALMPAELASICDRVFYTALKSRNLKAAVLQEKTVNYLCLWKEVYRDANEISPQDANRNIDFKRISDWLNGQNPRQLEIVYRRCGIVGRPNMVPKPDAGIKF